MKFVGLFLPSFGLLGREKNKKNISLSKYLIFIDMIGKRKIVAILVYYYWIIRNIELLKLNIY